MPEPDIITQNSAAIYSADLMYEQNCKCGMTEVILGEYAFNYVTNGDYGWKMVCLVDGTTLESINITNISGSHNAALATLTYEAGQELIGSIATFDCLTGGWIVYKDCLQS
tara:strand:- start:646 stop:978 length:333 start_codon:yes stop_codon:yes gene_type:complete